MEATELVKHRQEYLKEMRRFFKGIHFDEPTEHGYDVLMSRIPDEEIIYNVEHSISPFQTIEETVYYAVMC